MSDQEPSGRDRLRRLSSRAGFVASVFIVFASGWVAMRGTDWTVIGVSTAFALAGGYAASVFRRQG